MSRFRHERILKGVVHSHTGNISLRRLDVVGKNNLATTKLFDANGKRIPVNWRTVKQIPKTRAEVVAQIERLRRKASSGTPKHSKAQLTKVLTALQAMERGFRHAATCTQVRFANQRVPKDVDAVLATIEPMLDLPQLASVKKIVQETLQIPASIPDLQSNLQRARAFKNGGGLENGSVVFVSAGKKRIVPSNMVVLKRECKERADAYKKAIDRVRKDIDRLEKRGDGPTPQQKVLTKQARALGKVIARTREGELNPYQISELYSLYNERNTARVERVETARKRKVAAQERPLKIVRSNLNELRRLYEGLSDVKSFAEAKALSDRTHVLIADMRNNMLENHANFPGLAEVARREGVAIVFPSSAAEAKRLIRNYGDGQAKVPTNAALIVKINGKMLAIPRTVESIRIITRDRLKQINTALKLIEKK
ncbi:MAG: hypothetical protein HOC95_02355 [Candidatus Diapherotrites archaeon]|nr:hypothetical protein [Candidatus Diapherotrites archaeon]